MFFLTHPLATPLIRFPQEASHTRARFPVFSCYPKDPHGCHPDIQVTRGGSQVTRQRGGEGYASVRLAAPAVLVGQLKSFVVAVGRCSLDSIYIGILPAGHFSLSDPSLGCWWPGSTVSQHRFYSPGCSYRCSGCFWSEGKIVAMSSKFTRGDKVTVEVDRRSGGTAGASPAPPGNDSGSGGVVRFLLNGQAVGKPLSLRFSEGAVLVVTFMTSGDRVELVSFS